MSGFPLPGGGGGGTLPDGVYIDKGSIAASDQFPTTEDVKVGWTYQISADVVFDNDPTKTNTGFLFLGRPQIKWNGTNWTRFGNVVSTGGSYGYLALYDGTSYPLLYSDSNVRIDPGTSQIYTLGANFANTAYFVNGQAILSDANSTFTTDYLYINPTVTGTFTRVTQLGGALVTPADPAPAYPLIGQLTTTSMTASRNINFCASHVVVPNFIVQSGVTVTNLYGIYVQAGQYGGSGTATNGYGMYIAQPAYGTNKYAFGCDSLLVNGDITMADSNGKFYRKEGGADATAGIATLVSGVVTVATTSVTANSRIKYYNQQASGTAGALSIANRTPGTDFIIASTSASDSSTIYWEIDEPAP